MEPMRRIRKALILFLILILAGALVLECLNRTLLSASGRRWAENAAGRALGRKVSIGAIRLHPWHGFLLDRVSVAEDPSFGSAPFIEAEQVAAGLPLLIPTLRLTRPTVRLVQNPDGRWNFQGSRFHVTIPKVVVSAGRCEIHLQHPPGAPVIRIEGLEADLHLSLPAQIRGIVTADLVAEQEGRTQPVGRITLDGHYLLQEHRLALKGQSRWQLLNLLAFFPKGVRQQVERLEGSLSFDWETSGNAHSALETRGAIETSGLRWKIGQVEGSGDLSGQAQWDSHGVRTEGLTLRLSNGTLVEWSGSLANDPALSFGFRATSSFSAKEPPPIPPKWLEVARDLNLAGRISMEVTGNGMLRPKLSLRPTLTARLQEISMEPLRGPRTQIHSGQIRWQPDLITFTDLTGHTMDQPFRLEGTLVKWDQPEINASFSWGKWDGEAQFTLSSEKIDVESLTGRLGQATFRLFGEINRPGADANLYGEASFRAEDLPTLWPAAQEWVQRHSATGEISTRCLLQGPLLRPAEWDLELRAGSPAFQTDGVPLQAVSLDLQRKKRQWTLHAGKAGLAGGNLLVAGSLDGARAPSRWEGKIQLEGVQLEQLARALRWKTQDFSGQIQAEWSGGGESGRLQSVAGSGRIKVTGAKILELPLLGRFAEFLSLPTLRTIWFQETEGPFRVKEGRIEIDSLVIRSPQAALTISGWGGFLQGLESPIQWKILPSFAPELIPNIIVKGARYVSVQVELGGTWKEPKRKLVSPLQNIFRRLF